MRPSAHGPRLENAAIPEASSAMRSGPTGGSPAGSLIAGTEHGPVFGSPPVAFGRQLSLAPTVSTSLADAGAPSPPRSTSPSGSAACKRDQPIPPTAPSLVKRKRTRQLVPQPSGASGQLARVGFPVVRPDMRATSVSNAPSPS